MDKGLAFSLGSYPRGGLRLLRQEGGEKQGKGEKENRVSSRRRAGERKEV